MLSKAYKEGAAAALEVYGVKEGSLKDYAVDLGRTLKTMAIGQPSELLKGRALFRPGGLLHWENVFWPRTPHVGSRPVDPNLAGFKLHEPAGGFAAGTTVDKDVLKKLHEQGVTHAVTGPTWRHHLGVNASRLLQTGLPAYMLAQSAFSEGDPSEGRLSNILGSAGALAGSAYGGTALGALGQMALAPLGEAVGKRIGRVLGSRPNPPPPEPPRYGSPYGPGYPAQPPLPPYSPYPYR
jgi:hypothetical protein